MTGGRRVGRVLVALALVAVLAVAAYLTFGAGDSSAPDLRQSASAGGPAPATTTSSQQNAADASLQRLDEIGEVLSARAAAIVDRDRAAFLAGLDSFSSPFGVRQVGVFDSMTELPFGTFDYGTPQLASQPSAARAQALGPDATVVRLDATYTLAGYDRSPRHFETYLTLVRREGGWRLVDDTDGGTQTQLWDLPGLRVATSDTTLVAGNVAESTLEEYLALGDRAVADVGEVWPAAWGDRLVLVAPATTEQMAGQLLQAEDSVGQVAAVTDGSADADGRSGADRVVLNPTAFARLRPDGRQVVVTHETTHVAIRRTTTAGVPIWLSEGFADYVGYTSVGVARTAVAGQLLTRVREGQGPTAFPGPADFDPARTTIAPSYNAAYLAVCRLVDRYGEDAVARTYAVAATRTNPPVGTDAQLAAALSSELGTSVAEVTDDWLAYLRQLAG